MPKNIFIKSISLAFLLSLLPIKSYAKTQDFYDEAEFESYLEENENVVYDPFEKYNRKIFAFNDFMDRYFLEFLAKEYRKDIPKPARKIVRNFLTNLSAPISIFNSLVQGKGENSLATFSNFLINSTVGIGGLFDVASEKGIRYSKEDFGQTLGFYGIKSGPFLVVPFIGPSNIRDFSGMATDQIISPTSYNISEIGGKTYLIGEDNLIAFTFVGAIDTRESLIDIINDVKKDSFDYYATLRSAYNQRRINEIKN